MKGAGRAQADVFFEQHHKNFGGKIKAIYFTFTCPWVFSGRCSSIGIHFLTPSSWGQDSTDACLLATLCHTFACSCSCFSMLLLFYNACARKGQLVPENGRCRLFSCVAARSHADIVVWNRKNKTSTVHLQTRSVHGLFGHHHWSTDPSRLDLYWLDHCWWV